MGKAKNGNKSGVNMFENFNRLVEEAKQRQAEKQKQLEQEEQARIMAEKLKPPPFWREDDKRTTSSGVML